jgi:hypothetical protein
MSKVTSDHIACLILASNQVTCWKPVSNHIVIRFSCAYTRGVITVVARRRVAVTSAVVLASVLLALATPALIPAAASVNSHTLQIQCISSGIVITYPSGWVTTGPVSTTVTNGARGNNTYLIINFPPGLVNSFSYKNGTISSHGSMVTMTNNTYGIVIHSWNSTSCQGTLVKG